LWTPTFVFVLNPLHAPTNDPFQTVDCFVDIQEAAAPREALPLVVIPPGDPPNLRRSERTPKPPDRLSYASVASGVTRTPYALLATLTPTPKLDTTDWKLNGKYFEVACETYGKPELDAFASSLNSQLPNYWTIKDDAFTKAWGDYRLLWMNPPFNVLGRVVAKVKSDQATVILVTPRTPDAPWWGHCDKMSLCKPLVIPACPDLFLPVSTQNKKGIGMPPFDSVYIWHLSGKPRSKVDPDNPTFNQVLKMPPEEQAKWFTACQSELDSLQANGTFSDLIPLPPGAKALPCKWVLHKKYNPDGTVNKYKSRLVAQGQFQERDEVFADTFSPVIRHSSLRTLLSIALETDMQVTHFDVKSAFLHGELNATVYLSQPPGFVTKGKERHVYQLNKSLYGLIEANRVWNEVLDDILLLAGFARLRSEVCVYRKDDPGGSIFVAVYVDDILHLCPSKSLYLVTSFEALLKAHLEITNLGPVSYFLGWEIQRTSNTLTIHQSKYISDLLSRFGMSDCKPVHTPMDPDPK
jgi:Reverse transcriptase (RNA-dependent DNA polymerase)/DNA N-6-adenine-methyltransferase (Dam)